MEVTPTPDDVVVAIATAALLTACALAIALHLAVAVVWIRRRVRARQAQRATDRWQLVIARAAVGQDELPARDEKYPRAVRRSEALVVLELWVRHRDAVIDGSRLAALADASGLATHARRFAHRRGGRTQMAGVVALGWMGDSEDATCLERIAYRGREPIATAALASLIRLDAAVAVPLLRARLRPGPHPVPALVASALVQAKHGLVARLVRDEAAARASELPGLLRILALRRDGDGLAAVRAVLERADATSDALTAALYALAEIGRPRDVTSAVHLLHHDDWAVRVRAIHAVSRLGGREYTPVIAGLLEDGDPWVRRRAAEVVVGDPTAAVDTSALSEPARLAFEEALTYQAIAA